MWISSTKEIASQVEQKLQSALKQSSPDKDLSSSSIELFQDAVNLAQKTKDKSLITATWQEIADIVKGKFGKEEVPCFQFSQGGKGYPSSWSASRKTITPESQQPPVTDGKGNIISSGGGGKGSVSGGSVSSGKGSSSRGTGWISGGK